MGTISKFPAAKSFGFHAVCTQFTLKHAVLGAMIEQVLEGDLCLPDGALASDPQKLGRREMLVMGKLSGCIRCPSRGDDRPCFGKGPKPEESELGKLSFWSTFG